MKILLILIFLVAPTSGCIGNSGTETVDSNLGGPREKLDDANSGLFDGANYGQLEVGDVTTLTPIPTEVFVPSAEISKPVATSTPNPSPTSLPEFTFTEAVPEADSYEITSEEAGACFSKWSHEMNESQGLCLPEWFPKDYAPRSIDRFWCVSTVRGVEWVPARFYEGGSSPVVPYGYPERCK